MSALRWAFGEDYKWPTNREELKRLTHQALLLSPNLTTVKGLLGAGADPLHVLIEACGVRADTVISYLLTLPAIRSRLNDFGPESKTRYTALMATAEEGNVGTIRRLIAAGADPLIRHPENGMPAVWVASDHGRLAALQTLINAGADVEVPKTKPTSFRCVHVAAQNGHVEVLLALLRAGCNPGARNSNDHVALMSACCMGQLSAAACLIKHGAEAEPIFGGDELYAVTAAKIEPKVKAARRVLVDRSLLASPLSWPQSSGRGFDDAVSAGVRKCWAKDRKGCADPKLSLRRLAKAAADYLGPKRADGLGSTVLLGGRLLPPRLRFRLLYAASRYAELRAASRASGAREALAMASAALQVASTLQEGDRAGANKHDDAAAWLLEAYCVPRLVSALVGPQGSDARVVLLRRQALSTGAASPPKNHVCSYFNWRGRAYRIGGRTFDGSGMWKVDSSANELWSFDPRRTARESGGDGSNDPWSLVKCANSSHAPWPLRYGCAVGLHGDTAVVWGGASGQIGFSHTCDPQSFFTLDLLAQPEPKWKKIITKGACPAGRSCAGSAMLRGSLFIFGGTGDKGNDKLGDFWRLDVATKKWTAIKTSGTAPARRADCAMWAEAPSDILPRPIAAHTAPLIDASRMSVKELLAECKANGLPTAGCVEKDEFVSVVQAARQAQEAASQAPSLEERFGDGAGGRLRLFGGEVYPGQADGANPLDSELGCITTGDFFACALSEDLNFGTWEETPVLGDHPGILQEVNGVVLSEPSSNGDVSGPSQRVVIWGGYYCGRLPGKALDSVWAHTPSGEPYSRGIFMYQHGAWRYLKRLGEDSIAKAAQVWILGGGSESIHEKNTPGVSSFFALGGYGLTGQSKQFEETRAWALTPGGPKKQVSSIPELMSVYYHCAVFNPFVGAAGSDALFSNRQAFVVSMCKLGGEDAHGQSRLFVEEDADGNRIDTGTASPICAGGISLEVKHHSNSELAMVQEEHENARAELNGVGSSITVSWLVKNSEQPDKYNMNMDTYRGPVAPDVLKVMRGAGWDGKFLMYSPNCKGPLFEPPVKVPSPDKLYGAFAAMCAKQLEVDKPLAKAHAAKLSEVRPSPEMPRLTVRIEVMGVSPPIWRRVRVLASITLAEFHDQVLCPVLGYARNYHAYAFRTFPDPWLGPHKSTALDMAQLPFFVKALGSDRRVQLCALLPQAGATATYVHDFGDWLEHVLTLEAPGGNAEGTLLPTPGDDGSSGRRSSHECADGRATTAMVAELLGGEHNGIPSDVGGTAGFVTKLNQLMGVMPHENYQLAHSTTVRVVPPEQALWWTLLNDEFRKKNCKQLVYDPCRFDLAAARFELADALRRGTHDARAAAHSFVSSQLGRSRYDLDANQPQPPPGPGPANPARTAAPSAPRGSPQKQQQGAVARAGNGRPGAASACAVCGSTVALKACSRCKKAHYCSSEHQKADWPAHKPGCK